MVLDTNVLLSAAIWKNASPALAVRQSLLGTQILISKPYRDECEEVFQRPKFDRYTSVSVRLKFLEDVFLSAATISIHSAVTDCVDPKDNMILELALSGAADFIVTGDDHLLRLHPWRGVRILTPAAFLEM